LRLPKLGLQPTVVVSPPGVGKTGRLQSLTFLRRLWNPLDRTRKSLGACGFGFFALIVVPSLGQAPWPVALDPATAAAPACGSDATASSPPGSVDATLPEAVFRTLAATAAAAPAASAPASTAAAAATAAAATVPGTPAAGTPASSGAATGAAPAASGAPAAAAASGAPAAAHPAAGPPPPPAPVPTPPLRFDRSLGVPRTPYGKQIYKVALRYALNPLLVAAVVEAESAFNPRAVSRKGACGLMQVLPSTARRFGLHRRRDLFNPLKNLETGARYLRWLVDRFGDDALRVLAAYNAGEGSVERFGGLPPFRETRGYVQQIFARLGFTLLLPTVPVPVPALPALDSPALAAAGR
jgi:soluble lytic murein transglycosylase-like protein